MTDLLFDKAIVKSGEVSRAVPINTDGRDAIETLKKAFEVAGLNGKLVTHSIRKSFAQRLYD